MRLSIDTLKLLASLCSDKVAEGIVESMPVLKAADARWEPFFNKDYLIYPSRGLDLKLV